MSNAGKWVVATAAVIFMLAGQARAQEVVVGPCGGTSVSPSGRSFQCARDKRPACNTTTRVCYCVTRPECKRR